MIAPPIGKRRPPKIVRNGAVAQRRRVYCPACDKVSSVTLENAAAPCRSCKGPVELRERGRPKTSP